VSAFAAREVIPGAIWAFDLPIRPGETGSVCLRCGEWHWFVSLRSPGWTPARDAHRFVNYGMGPSFIEYGFCATPADPAR